MGEAARWLREGAARDNGGEKASATRGKQAAAINNKNHA
jgi:hypothetical protein